MTKVNKNNLNEQRAFFQECMELAGYKTYSDLAKAIVLSLPNEIDLNDKDELAKAQRKIAASIGGLASGTIAPIFNDTENKGKIRPLASEVACLLSVDHEVLFSATPEFAKDSESEEFDDRFDATPDINLIRRDIDNALGTLSEENRSLLLHQYVWGRNQTETATEMSINTHRVASLFNTAKQAWDNRLRNELRDYQPQKIELGEESGVRRNLLGYFEMTKDFNASSFVNKFIMNAARLNSLISRHSGIPDSLFIKLQREASDVSQFVQKVLSQHTASGPVLSSCSGFEVTSLLRAFTKVGYAPSANFMSTVETVCKKNSAEQPYEYWMGSRSDFNEAVSEISAHALEAGNNGLQTTCARILNMP
jgi:DNA-directed RNA polymerase specialized sigma24 family protein